MIYQHIEKELDLFEGDVFFINLMPDFIWCDVEKTVKQYASAPDLYNDLSVIQTELIELETTLTDYLTEQEVQKTDILVFCLNESFIPKDDKNWVRIKIMKNTRKKEFKRNLESHSQQRLKF